MLAIIKILPPCLSPDWFKHTLFGLIVPDSFLLSLSALFCPILLFSQEAKEDLNKAWESDDDEERGDEKGRDGGRARLQLLDSQDCFSQLGCVRNNSYQPQQILLLFFLFF